MNTNPRYEQIEKPCPSCGMKAVWLCSMPDCPKKGEQVEARKTWLDMSTNPPEDMN